MTRSLVLALLLLLLLSTGVVAEEVRYPKSILDDEDLSIHVVETSCNSYLITCKRTGEFVVVDPGPRLGGTYNAWKMRHTPKGIWLTHEHGDHLGGLRECLSRRAVPVFAHGLARAAIEKALAPRNTQSGTAPDKPPALALEVIKDGSVLQVGEMRWRALHLPGHAPGSIGYLLPGRALLAGDVLFKGSIGRTDLRGSDPEALAKALGTKLWPLPDEVVVFPGHGPHTTMGAEKRTNRLFQDFARRGRGEAPIPRPWMGVQLDPEHPGPSLRLAQVVAGSPAAVAGLQVGDVLTAIGGVALAAPADLGAAIRRHAVGDAVPVVYRRGATTQRCTLTFAVQPVGR